MACYLCGQSRERIRSGRCCGQDTAQYNWCADCDPGVEAVFVPCGCRREAQQPMCSCRQRGHTDND